MGISDWSSDVCSSDLLPDRDYYLEKNDKFESVRKAYVAHIEKMLTLAKLPDPAANAKAITALETKLAQAQWYKVVAAVDYNTSHIHQTHDRTNLTPDLACHTHIDPLDGHKTAGRVARA